MCKFHKDVAIAVATDPHTGSVDPLRYSVTLCAIAKFWIDKYMPDMGYQDGYSNYEMSSKTARQSFENSGLEKDLLRAREGQPDRVEFLRSVADKVIAEMKLTAGSLHLPKRPDKSPHFLDSVMLGIFEGDPQIELVLKKGSDVPNEKHKPLRDVMERLYQEDGYKDALEASLKSSVANLFIQAPELINPQLLKAYDHLPTGFRTAFGSCSLHGGGGALTHLVVCGGLNSAIGGFSGAFMNAAMWGVAPAVALATTYAEEKYRYNDFNPYKYILPVAISLAAAFGVSRFLPHEHSDSERMRWFYSMNAEQRFDELGRQHARFLRLSQPLQKEVELEAARQSMTIPMFMVSLNVCGGNLVPKIAAYEMQKAKETPVQALK